MDIDQSCSLCSGQATLVCICSTVLLCKRCAVQHITQSEKVHTLLPTSVKAMIKVGGNPFDILQRVENIKALKDYVRTQIEAIEVFKLNTQSKIDAAAATITSTLAASTTQKLEKLRDESEACKLGAREFVAQNREEQADQSKYDTDLFMRKAMARRSKLRTLPIYKSNYQEQNYEEVLQQCFAFKMDCPSSQLLSLRTK
jgi:hypothetical protein